MARFDQRGELNPNPGATKKPGHSFIDVGFFGLASWPMSHLAGKIPNFPPQKVALKIIFRLREGGFYVKVGPSQQLS
jgi:hypothetical protein